MNTFMQSLSLSLALVTSPLQGDIHPIASFQAVEPFLPSKAMRDDWLLVDIDYTLTAPALSSLQKELLGANKKRFKEEMSQFAEEERDLIPMLMVTHAPSRLLEENSPEWLKRFQSQGATVAAFTALGTFSLPDVGNLSDWRAKELKRLGLEFAQDSSSPLPLQEVKFTQFASYRATYPTYSAGVLNANYPATKGELLGALLDQTSQLPRFVILVDDTLENLEQVERELSRRSIRFVGLLYQPPARQPYPIDEEEWTATWHSLRERAKGARLDPCSCFKPLSQ